LCVNINIGYLWIVSLLVSHTYTRLRSIHFLVNSFMALPLTSLAYFFLLPVVDRAARKPHLVDQQQQNKNKTPGRQFVSPLCRP